MGSRYLIDLAVVCRRTGAVVHEEPGWQTRARSSGGYSSGLPSHIMIHHTASGPSSDGQGDVTYMCHGADAAPVANLYLSRAGEIWVMAAGATNTNGAGHAWWAGGPADDSMNTAAIGLEAANGGTGEVWPDRQQSMYLALVRELRAAYGVTVDHVRDHQEWAGSRKCDVTGPARWAPAGNHAGCSGAPKWDMNRFRADVAGGGGGAGTLALLEGEAMHYYIKPENEATSSTTWVSDGTYKWAMHSGGQLEHDRFFQEARLTQLGASDEVARGFSATIILNRDGFRAMGYNIDPAMTGRDAWGWRA